MYVVQNVIRACRRAARIPPDALRDSSHFGFGQGRAATAFVEHKQGRFNFRIGRPKPPKSATQTKQPDVALPFGQHGHIVARVAKPMRAGPC
jgi:hypothetical protein